jgi:hypothetical protein
MAKLHLNGSFVDVVFTAARLFVPEGQHDSIQAQRRDALLTVGKPPRLALWGEMPQFKRVRRDALLTVGKLPRLALWGEIPQLKRVRRDALLPVGKPSRLASQALCAWLLSGCPSRTK